jgi:hypothetical protein
MHKSGRYSRPWSQLRIAGVGALGNGLAFAAAALAVAWLLSDDVLRQFYKEHARVHVVINTSLIGVVIGFMVLWQFKRSECDRAFDAARAAERAGIPTLAVLPPTEDLDPTRPSIPDVAARNYGGYARATVEYLEGRYVCFRPAFTSAGLICAYLMDLRWDPVASCLIFEEKNREDAGHTQRGRVYIPDGRPFMNFVTVAEGGIRLIMVSRPWERESACGLIMTLSNPSGTQFTPASAPIVLRRVADRIPQLGFIRSDAPEYESYRQELEAVAPEFGFFATAPRPVSGAGAKCTGKALEYAIGHDAVVALAQHGEEIRDDEKGCWGRKQEAADHRACQRRVLLLARAADRHRDHADDHGRRRHQHRPDPGMARVKGGSEGAPPFELLLAREGDQEDGVRRGDADRHDRGGESRAQ